MTTDSITALEATLAAQRDQLAAELEELGSRIAPQALKRQGREQVRLAADRARDAAGQWCDRAREGVELTALRARDALASHASCAPGEVCPVRHPRQALAQLLDDARAGEPGALAIATGAACVLIGLGALAVRRAVRS